MQSLNISESLRGAIKKKIKTLSGSSDPKTQRGCKPSSRGHAAAILPSASVQIHSMRSHFEYKQA